MPIDRRKDLAPKQTIFSEICLSAAIFLPQTLIFLYICGGGNCSVFREHSLQISISIYTWPHREYLPFAHKGHSTALAEQVIMIVPDK